MKRNFDTPLLTIIFICSIFFAFSVNSSNGQIGNLIWEENFNNLDNWIINTGNGSWGWGNGELEFYKEEN